MTVAGVEPVAEAVRASLETYLPAKIAVLQPTLSPVLPMAQPKEYRFGAARTYKAGYPVVAVLPRPTRIRYEDLRWQDHVHRVEVAVFVQHPNDEDALERLLARYARCVVEVLIERRKADAFTPYDLVLRDELIDYDPIAALRAGMLTRAVFIPARFTSRSQERH